MESRVIEKIKKLLALANSENVHESEQAMKMANMLLMKHNIEMSSLTNVTETIEENNQYMTNFTKEALLSALVCKRFYFVEVIKGRKFQKGSYIALVGTKENTEIASYVFNFIIGAFKKCFKNAKLPAKSRQSFYQGMYEGICQQLSEQKKTFENQCGLMVINHSPKLVEYMNNMNTRTSKVRNNTSDSGAVKAGLQAGYNLKIAKGLASSTSENNVFKLRA